jgi:glycopeptide antibiotics resistance protein
MSYLGANSCSVAYLATLRCILEAPGPNLGTEIDFFVVFLSPFRKCWDSTLNYTTTASFHILFNSLIILSFGAVESALLAELLNKSQTKKRISDPKEKQKIAM